jgi:hypothetical protein
MRMGGFSADELQILLQARIVGQVRMVLAFGARDQVFLRHYIVRLKHLSAPSD